MVHLTEVAKYFGEKRALGPVSFEVPRGETVGVLGLNGVGKTTLLRILACDLRPSAGQVIIDGFDALADPHEVRKRVGFLPERPPVYGEMTVGDYLEFAGRVRGLDPPTVAERKAVVEDVAQLTEVDGELVRNLSQGFRQRVGVAQAIIHDPELLILDEPTHDLDPVQIREMREMIRGLKRSHTILVSSHILSEISQTCDRVLILNRGRVIASGTEEELSGRLLHATAFAIDVAVNGVPPGGDGAATASVQASVTELIRSVPDVGAVECAQSVEGVLTFAVEAAADCRAAVCRALVDAGHDVVRLERTRRELESVFVELVGEATE